MNHPTYIHHTDQAIAAWAQLTLWILADDAGDDPPAPVHVAPRPVTRCPLCRAAMQAGGHECPACGIEVDI